MFEIGPALSRFWQIAQQAGTSHGLAPIASLVLVMAIQVGLAILGVLLVPIVLVYAERKVSAFMQARLGPMEVGPFGIFQTIADGIKLFFKEDIIPTGADRWVHIWAPIIACAPAFICYAPVPFGKNLLLVDLDIGVLFIFAISGVSVIGILMGGWGSGNKFSMLGGIRAAAQVVSYEVPRVLSVVPVLMFYSSQSLRQIALAQQDRWLYVVPKWFILYPVIGQVAFLIFLICSVAETNRTPFDIAEAESELVAGFHTEFSGLKFALFFLAEYAYVFLASAMATALFLGGGDGFLSSSGWIPSWFWFLGKTFAIVFVFLWFRWTYPRMRVDQLMSFCWKFLLPLSFINILLTGLWILWR
ncbi:MAG: NADH-quinone oxidoreductase subunit NuoH [Elusimicrobiota bacterium]|jgi:NADH-quinone oxidoreductase subunit H